MNIVSNGNHDREKSLEKLEGGAGRGVGSYEQKKKSIHLVKDNTGVKER